MRITDLTLRQLPFTQSGQKRYRDDQIPNFGVIVGTRNKTFFVQLGDARRTKTIGRYPALSLKDARDKAKRLLIDSPPEPTVAMSFSEARDAFLADCRTRLRKSTVDRYFFALKDIKAKSLDTVSRNIADPNQIKALKAMYNWCIDRDYTDRNPFMRRKVRFNQRERVLTDDEVRAVWHYDHRPFSDIVKLLLLTGQRRNQIWQLHPGWIGEDTIAFPAEVMKNAAQHVIPFGGLTAQYLPEQPFSFNSWSKSKARIDRVTGVVDWTLHDLRRTFATAHAKIGTPIHVAEAHLAHSSGTISGVAAIYFRHNWLEEMRVAVQRYEDHIKQIVGGNDYPRVSDRA